jgi:hypothetical protein
MGGGQLNEARSYGRSEGRMRTPLVKPWTPEEVERMLSLQKRGASPGRVAVALKRPVKSVLRKALMLGSPFPSRRQVRRGLILKEDEARKQAGLQKAHRPPLGRS